jgi:hypothetical protein
MSGFGSCGSNSRRYSIIVGVIIVLLLGSVLIANFPENNDSNYRSLANLNGDLYSKCPMRPGPFEGRQPNNYSFLFNAFGDEWGHITYYLPINTEGGVSSPAHPIEWFDGWWYFCYWNESLCWVTITYPPIDPEMLPLNQSSGVEVNLVVPPEYRITVWHPLLISTEVKIGDPLPSRTFAFTQLNGRTFKAKLAGPLDNPHWETPSGKLIIQVPTYTADGVKGIWFYAEHTSDNLILSTGVPVCEHGTPVNLTQNPLDPPVILPNDPPSEDPGSTIPGFTMLFILPAFVLVFLYGWKKRSAGLEQL